MAAILTSYASKAVVKNAAVQVTVNHLFDDGAEKIVPPIEPIVIDHFECLEMVYDALVVWRALGIALSLYGFRQGLSHPLAVENKATFNGNKRAGSDKMHINPYTV